MINNDASSQLVNRFDYAYNDAAHPDQRSSETVTNGAFFTFPQNELTRYEHNSLNQLIHTTAPEKLFTYDDAGNMTKGYTPDGYQFAGTYDAENRLASIEYTDSGSTVHKAEYIYSSYGFLSQIKKYDNGTPVGDIRIMRSEYLAIQERDATNQVVREYTWGLNMGGGIGGLLSIRQGGNDYKYLYDGRGNVSALLNTSQQVAASYRYDSFGNLMAKTGTLDQPFGFSTKRYDAGTGLSFYGYRFYAPTIGKWLTRDPLGEAGGINLYGFCLNDPLGLEVLLPESDQPSLGQALTGALMVSDGSMMVSTWITATFGATSFSWPMGFIIGIETSPALVGGLWDMSHGFEEMFPNAYCPGLPLDLSDMCR